MELTSTRRRVCLLTGASGVLGRAFCAAYRHEYDIVAVYRRERPWFPAQDAQVVDPLQGDASDAANDNPIYALRADLLARNEARRVVDCALARYGTVDLLVNAAVSTLWASMIGSPELVDSVQRQFAMAVDIPLRLATLLATQCWQGDARGNRDRNRNIVNVSSVAALRVYQGSGQSVYAASKAAMNHLTAHMASEFTRLGVRVNATAANSFPGIVATQRAVDAVRALDQSDRTGMLVVVDGAADEWRPLDAAAP
jgi:NAD(P)-dependent dehydrogenase (short-subunit alcohol dehydrogenase family)